MPQIDFESFDMEIAQRQIDEHKSRSCIGKVQHSSLSIANDEAFRLDNISHEGREGYYCSYCNSFHVGHKWFYIAVYGTLKTDWGNYDHYIKPHIITGDAKLVAIGKLIPGYELRLSGIPYMIKTKEGHPKFQPNVEVFAVTKVVRDAIDRLEGHPGWYRRTKVEMDPEHTELYVTTKLENMHIEAYCMAPSEAAYKRYEDYPVGNSWPLNHNEEVYSYKTKKFTKVKGYEK